MAKTTKTGYYIHEDIHGVLHILSEEIELHAVTAVVSPKPINEYRARLSLNEVALFYSETPEEAKQRYVRKMQNIKWGAERKIKFADEQLEKAAALLEVLPPR